MIHFPNVALRDILSESQELVQLDPTRRYRQVTVRLWGKGVVQRAELPGSEIASSTQHVVRHNQFILSRIDARNGALGLVPQELDGAITSNDFPSFILDKSRVLPTYLNWMSKTADFVDTCRAASEGTTNRVRLQIGRFLAQQIPLPPLAEQQRIVSRVEELAGKIERARRLRAEVIEGGNALCRSIISGTSVGSNVPTPMSQIVSLREPDILVVKNQEYQFAGVYCFGKGVFKGPRKTGMDFAYPRLTQIQAGNFVYPKLMAWEGALGVVPPSCDGFFVSPEFPVFEIDRSQVLPETLDTYFRTPSVWPLLAGASTGTNVRRRRLNPSDFLSFKMPLPSMDTQILLRQVSTQMERLNKWQTDSVAEFEALLPSVLSRAFAGEL